MTDALVTAAPGWLALGVVLHLANQVARGRGWYAVVRAASGDSRLRRRDAIAAWVAGAAAGGVLSARGGDAVRILLLTRRVPGCARAAGTLAAEGVGELLVGAALVAAALALGVGPRIGLPAPWLLAAAALVLVAALRLPAVRRIARRAGEGCAALRDPRAYARGVLPWQVASRACRLGALACFLAAFGLPATLAAVLLVVFAQTGGRVVPFGPASVGAGVAMLAASFEPVTGTAAPAAQLAAFFVGTSALLTVAGLAIAVPICLRTAGLSEVVQASAKLGRRARAGLGRPVPARVTSIPAP